MSEPTMIRDYDDADAVALSRLIGHTMLTTNVREYPVERLRELAEWFSAERVRELNENRICLVAERDGAVLGTIGIELPPGDPHPATTILVTFFVAPSTQGQGIGGLLLDAAESRAREAGFTTIHLEASLAGVGFYESHGFARTGRMLTGHAGEHVEMTKRLT